MQENHAESTETIWKSIEIYIKCMKTMQNLHKKHNIQLKSIEMQENNAQSTENS